MEGGAVVSQTKRDRRRPPAWTRVRGIGGITYRQFDYWVRCGYVRVENTSDGSGHRRYITDDELEVLTRGVHLVNLGILPATAFPAARALCADGTAALGPGYRIELAS